jgi:hypothetical protein
MLFVALAQAVPTVLVDSTGGGGGWFGYNVGMNNTMTYWTAAAFAGPRLVTEVSTVIHTGGFTGNLVVSFFAAQGDTPVGTSPLGSATVFKTIAAGNNLVVSTGDISSAGIVLNNAYFGVQVHFVGGFSNTEVKAMSGMSGGTMDNIWFEDDNGNGVLSLSGGEYTPRTLYGVAPAVKVMTDIVPEPSSIFGLLVGGSSLLAMLRRKA